MSQPEPMPGDFGKPRLLVPAPGDQRYQHLGWPKIVRADDGTLVIAALAGPSHITGGCPVVCRSTDGGRTFSEPQVVLDVPRASEFGHSGNVAFGKADDGSLILLAMLMTRGTSETGIAGWRSTDAGVTWQDIDTSNLSGDAGSVYGHIFPTPEGLCLAGHCREGTPLSDHGIWIAHSQDHGQSWSKARLVCTEALVEPAIIHTAGRYVGLIRCQRTASYREALSDDGHKWTWEASGVGRGSRLPSPFIVADPDNPSVVWALQTDRNHENTPEGQAGIWLWRGDAAQTPVQWEWQSAIAHFDPSQGGEPDYGYPWMAHLEGNRWLVVMYCGHFRGPNALWGLEISV